ncbi:MAG: hypothetical protein ACREC6_02710 [Hyphomicrobiaceae bacterium]
MSNTFPTLLEEAALSGLPEIPVLDVGADFPLETLERESARAHALFDEATRHVPRSLLKAADAVSRRWLVHSRNPHLRVMDAIAARLGRSGAYYLNVNYEWGCTAGLKVCPERKTARLVRVLDWPTAGLGRSVVAACVRGAAGPFVTLTWPGYTGVLQALAPGRFAAAINQPPMRKLGGGVFPLDWFMNRIRVWRSTHLPPSHVLRTVFETAADYAEAKRILTRTPLAAPAIFSLAGLNEHEMCIVERMEDEAHVCDGPAAAANHWRRPGWSGHARGIDSAGRGRMMEQAAPDFDPTFAWLRPPVRNDLTRLAMIADPAQRRLLAQGYEADGPATRPLQLAV